MWIVPSRPPTANVLPCKSNKCEPALAPIVSEVNGATLVVARTTQKKLAPETGAAAKVIWFSAIVKEVIGSCITPPSETNNVYGLPGKKD